MNARESITYSLRSLATLEPSRTDFARRVASTPQNVAHWLNDGKLPSIDKLVEIADVYDVSLDAMAGREARSALMPEEMELVRLMRRMDETGRSTLVQVARALEAAHRA